MDRPAESVRQRLTTVLASLDTSPD